MTWCVSTSLLSQVGEIKIRKGQLQQVAEDMWECITFIFVEAVLTVEVLPLGPDGALDSSCLHG